MVTSKPASSDFKSPWGEQHANLRGESDKIAEKLVNKTNFDVKVDEGKRRLNLSRDKKKTRI